MKVEADRVARVSARVRVLAIMSTVVMLAAVQTGCAVAMLGGAARSSSSAGSSGATSAPAGRTSPNSGDQAISTAVRSRFGASQALKGLKLTVDTHDGIVTLRGQVNNVDQRNAAQLEARAVQGVRAVKNELTVR
jgi:hyperosmotically inducible protein